MIDMTNEETIPLKISPRAFSAFGADLVTNDNIAITELVKNSYDAFAYNVVVEFGEDEGGTYIKIIDDGLGMTRQVIKEVWAVLATKHKVKNPLIERDGKIRKVSGNKGLGRFSAAKLGNTMDIWTKSPDDGFLKIKINWKNLVDFDDLGECQITMEELNDTAIFQNPGTIIRIGDLNSIWGPEKILDTKDSLSRLIAPFKNIDNFTIQLRSSTIEGPVNITTPKFIEKPPYKITGNVDAIGTIHWEYTYSPTNINHHPKTKTGIIDWNEGKLGFTGYQEQLSLQECSDEIEYSCGPFSFEIRVWDLDVESRGEISAHYDIGKNDIRRALAQYKGLSIYRDNILVLPKSDASKDWLGIDLRRVSRIGKRISTNQIIGIVNINSKDNPELKDTTDREKLMDTKEYKEFTNLLGSVINQLENLRSLDKTRELETTSNGKKPLVNLFTSLSAERLVGRVQLAVEKGEDNQQILKYINEFNNENRENIDDLQKRVTYYAQTASLGSVAIVILHELLNGMNAIKRFIKRVEKTCSPLETKTRESLEDASESHARLVDLAQTFAPLARKDLHKSEYKCLLRETADKSIRLIRAGNNAQGVVINNYLPNNILLPMHEGLLQTIFINLLDNACYWIHQNGQEKTIDITANITDDNQTIKIFVSDTGVGVSEEDSECIFEAGETSKSQGFGMGLVIVTEILSNHGGKVGVLIPSLSSGATFEICMPLAKGDE